MEPSFWSWEKRRFDPWLISKICAAMEPSFWSWEKPEDDPWSEETWAAAMEPSFWSWEKFAFFYLNRTNRSGRNGAQLLELGKELAIFSPTDYQCCTSLRAAEVLGQTSRVVAP